MDSAPLTSRPLAQGFFAFADSEADACSSFIESYVQAQGLIVVSAAAASVVNVLLGG